MLSAETVAALCGFAFLAGFVDAIVGGGGLIQLPALLILVPGAPVATLLGTNKVASAMGT
ncbi:MAG: sulfite exporter TauE/SafE family protein, partial [bacterium]